MADTTVIQVQNMTKTFKVYYDKSYQLKEKILFRNRNKYEERVVLDDISFSIEKGMAVGLIGHNGCGKSTLLKILARIMYPDQGSVKVSGRISSLIELGAGFHLDMSGRENIYINASIFGLTRKEIEAKIDGIVQFSELEEFIDNPVRTYSSGMYMRLAFAVAINVDSEVLLIDEILAVGDVTFQAKCFDKLRELKAAGTTIVIVSHSLGQIEQICDKTIWLHDGLIRAEGTPHMVHPRYLEYMGEKKREQEKKEGHESALYTSEVAHDNASNDRQEFGNRDIEIMDVQLLNAAGKKCTVFRMGESIGLHIVYKKNNPKLESSEFGYNIFRNDGVDCFGTNTMIDKKASLILKDMGTIDILLISVPLLRGKYKIDIAFHDRGGLNYHYIYTAAEFEVLYSYDAVGVLHMDAKWFADGKEL